MLEEKEKKKTLNEIGKFLQLKKKNIEHQSIILITYNYECKKKKYKSNNKKKILEIICQFTIQKDFLLKFTFQNSAISIY